MPSFLLVGVEGLLFSWIVDPWRLFIVCLGTVSSKKIISSFCPYWNGYFFSLFLLVGLVLGRWSFFFFFLPLPLSGSCSTLFVPHVQPQQRKTGKWQSPWSSEGNPAANCRRLCQTVLNTWWFGLLFVTRLTNGSAPCYLIWRKTVLKQSIHPKNIGCMIFIEVLLWAWIDCWSFFY